MLWLAIALTAHATEGMWLPEQVPDVAPAFEQLAIEPEALADPLGHPLGAVVSLGGCTASFVSPDGLIATNHHCVERKLQYLSDDDHDRVLEGYRAATRDDEAWVGPTGRVYVVERIAAYLD